MLVVVGLAIIKIQGSRRLVILRAGVDIKSDGIMNCLEKGHSIFTEVQNGQD